MSQKLTSRPSMKSGAAKVLMYHRVIPGRRRGAVNIWAVTQSQLYMHLELLQKWGYTCISFEDHSLAMSGRLELPKKPVMLTFDDGYEEIYRYALPVLKEFGVRATLFVLGSRSMTKNSWDTPANSGGAPLLNRDMICELHDAGFEIGSHSMTHADLTKIGRKEAWDEIASSKAELEDLIKSPVLSFAYPFGSVNAELEDMVKAAQYEYGCGVYSGPPRFSTNLFDIRRIQISATTNALDFSIKMLTPYGHYNWLQWKARRVIAARPKQTGVRKEIRSSNDDTAVEGAGN